jgi:uncharacterized protein Veg
LSATKTNVEVKKGTQVKERDTYTHTDVITPRKLLFEY